jgi:glutamate/tyrosine decarboxylase-like PLP-dependent enzyme
MDDARRAKLFAYATERATRFRAGVGDAIARPVQNYNEALASFCEPLPEHSSEAKAVLAELADKAERGLMKPTGGRFFGWVVGGSHPAGVAADWLVSAWGQNTGNHHASPAASAAETVAADWLLELLDLPRECSVGFATGATVANFTCLAAARGEVLRKVGWDADSRLFRCATHFRSDWR